MKMNTNTVVNFLILELNHQSSATMNVEVLETRIKTMPKKPKSDSEPETRNDSHDEMESKVFRAVDRQKISYDDSRNLWKQNAKDHARLERRADGLDFRMGGT